MLQTINHKKQLIFYFLCLLFSFAYGQLEEKDFVLYSQHDGLSNNLVTGIAQDESGYLWISTRKGLNRYNGFDFAQFHTDSSYNSLPIEDIAKLEWLNEYRLGAFTSMGLHIVNTRNSETSNIIIPAGELKYEFKVNVVMSVLSNKKGDVFILTRSGFYHYDENAHLVYRFDYYKKEEVESIPFQFGNNMVWFDEKNILIVAIDGLHSYNIVARSLKKIESNEYPLLTDIAELPHTDFLIRQINRSSFIMFKPGADTVIYADTKKNWKVISKLALNPLAKEFSYRSNLYRINDTLFYITASTNGFFKMILNPLSGKITLDTKKYFPGYYCSTIFNDKENRIWIGTNKGILKQQNHKSVVQSVELTADSKNRLPAPSIQHLFVFHDKIYASGRRKGELFVFDKLSLKLLKKINYKKYLSSSDNVSSIVHSNSDTLLIGTNGPLFWLKSSTGEIGEVRLQDWDSTHDWISAQFKDSRGNVWITSGGGLVYNYNRLEKRFTRLTFDTTLFIKILSPHHINEDAAGNIWMGGHGLYRFNRITGQVDRMLDSFPYFRFQRKEIEALEIDKKNTLWFGNAYNGLLSYNLSTKAFQHFTNLDGLPDNILTALKIVKDKLWIATGSGIASLDLLTNKIAAYGTDDGFPAQPITGNAFFYDPVSNQLYLGFDNWLVRFNPDGLLQPIAPPDFFIESIRLGNNSTIIHPSDTIITRYLNNNLSVNIGNINYNDVQNQRFLYRLLNGKDSTWKTLVGQPVINFNNLSPGTYKLQVKLYAANNRWPQQLKTLTLIIQPPFWQTWWFRILGVLVIVVFMVWYIRQRIRNMSRKAKIDKQLAELEIKGLHAQMNPHFIFNALNSIKDMILHDEKNNASRYLSKFAQLIRLTLEHSQQTFITLQENIEYLQHYLEMEELRFGDFHYEITTDPSIQTNVTLLPPMLLQPLVENAIWHGLLPKPGEKKVNIRFQKHNDALVCEIEDNGIGINTSLENKTISINRSMGIENIKRRMEVLNEKYKLHYQLTIRDKKEIDPSNGTGTIVLLSLPLNTSV